VEGSRISVSGNYNDIINNTAWGGNYPFYDGGDWTEVYNNTFHSGTQYGMYVYYTEGTRWKNNRVTSHLSLSLIAQNE